MLKTIFSLKRLFYKNFYFNIKHWKHSKYSKASKLGQQLIKSTNFFVFFLSEVWLLQMIQIKHQNQIRINLPIFIVTCVMCDDFVSLLQMKNCKWRIANAELQMKNCKWRIANEELQIKNCKWRIANVEMQMTNCKWRITSCSL
jgi:thiamine pyrophosphokinase